MKTGSIKFIGGPSDGMENVFSGELPDIIFGFPMAICSRKVWQQAEYAKQPNGEYHFTGNYKEQPLEIV